MTRLYQGSALAAQANDALLNDIARALVNPPCSDRFPNDILREILKVASDCQDSAIEGKLDTTDRQVIGSLLVELGKEFAESKRGLPND